MYIFQGKGSLPRKNSEQENSCLSTQENAFLPKRLKRGKNRIRYVLEASYSFLDGKIKSCGEFLAHQK